MTRQTHVVRSEGRSASTAQGLNTGTEIVFSLSGAVTFTTSPPWVRRSSGVLVEIVALLGTPGTAPTSVSIQKNGITVHTITIAAGQTTQIDAGLAIPFAGLVDRLTDTISGIGPGASDLTILHWFGA